MKNTKWLRLAKAGMDMIWYDAAIILFLYSVDVQCIGLQKFFTRLLRMDPYNELGSRRGPLGIITELYTIEFRGIWN